MERKGLNSLHYYYFYYIYIIAIFFYIIILCTDTLKYNYIIYIILTYFLTLYIYMYELTGFFKLPFQILFYEIPKYLELKDYISYISVNI